MKIRLNTRPLIIDKDEKFEEVNWEELCFNGLKDAILKIRNMDWYSMAASIRKTAMHDEGMTIYKLIEPALNLYNKENEAQLYMGFFENDYFDLKLSIYKNEKIKDFEATGLSFEQVLKSVELFFEEKYDDIKDLLLKPAHSYSKIKSLLEDRSEQETRKRLKRSLLKLGIYIAFLILLYLWAKYFR